MHKLQKLRTAAKWLEWVCLGMIPAVAAIQRIAPDTVQSPILREIIRWFVNHPFGPIVGLAVGGIVGKGTQSALERYQSSHAAIKAVLDAAHTSYFAGVPENERYLHRVTLFRARRYWRDIPFTFQVWQINARWKPKLRMRCRSGTAYQRSTHPLSLDDENESGNEGVAGRAYFANGVIVAPDLLEWPVPEPADPAADPACVAYATQGFMSIESCRRVRIKSRSVTASVVRKAGARWGVVVFDSREPQGAGQAPEKNAVLKLTAFLLGQMV
jgi:hypothetical protein